MVLRLLERWIQQVDRFHSFRFEANLVKLRRDDIALSVAPEHLQGVGSEGNITWIASLERSLEDDDGVREVLIALALDDVILCVVLHDLVEI